MTRQHSKDATGQMQKVCQPCRQLMSREQVEDAICLTCPESRAVEALNARYPLAVQSSDNGSACMHVG